LALPSSQMGAGGQHRAAGQRTGVGWRGPATLLLGLAAAVLLIYAVSTGLYAVQPRVDTARPVLGTFALILFLPAAVLTELLGRTLRALPPVTRTLTAAPRTFYAAATAALMLLAVPLSQLSAVEGYEERVPTAAVYIGAVGILVGLPLLTALRPLHARLVGGTLALAVLVASLTIDY
jgi:hypothetical protein